MNNLVLYRKYRPQKFSDVVGQEHVVKTIQNSLKRDKISHAYLFTGPRGTGKTTIARLLAKSLNCEDRNEFSEPCNKCQRCVEASRGQDIDLIEIDAASNRGIDEIRDLKEGVRFGASRGKYKVYLIDEIHMMTRDAFNAFLKTLEEPPPFVVFILATTEPHKLLPTVISRTQRFDFRLLNLKEIEERLKKILSAEKVKVKEEQAIKLIAQEANGSIRDAESLLGQVLAFSKDEFGVDDIEEILGLVSYSRLKKFVDLLIKKDRAGSLIYIQETAEAGQDFNQFLSSLIGYLRYLLLIGLDEELAKRFKKEINEEDFKILKSQSGEVDSLKIGEWMSVFTEAKEDLESYPLPQITLEVAVVEVLKNSIRDREETPEKIENSEEDTSEVKDASVKTLLDKWEDIADALKPHNHSLSAFVKAVTPQKIDEDGVLTISTKFSFHKERIQERKNRLALEDAIKKALGKKVSVRCILKK